MRVGTVWVAEGRVRSAVRRWCLDVVHSRGERTLCGVCVHVLPVRMALTLVGTELTTRKQVAAGRGRRQ